MVTDSASAELLNVINHSCCYKIKGLPSQGTSKLSSLLGKNLRAVMYSNEDRGADVGPIDFIWPMEF